MHDVTVGFVGFFITQLLVLVLIHPVFPPETVVVDLTDDVGLPVLLLDLVMAAKALTKVAE